MGVQESSFATFRPSRSPRKRLLVPRAVRSTDRVEEDRLAGASDHLPTLVDVELTGPFRA